MQDHRHPGNAQLPKDDLTRFWIRSSPIEQLSIEHLIWSRLAKSKKRYKDELTNQTDSPVAQIWVGAARTRTPSGTNYDVHSPAWGDGKPEHLRRAMEAASLGHRPY
ncbi:hypothetical protein BHE74_00018358 [Ensete ventricosum]|nr:hypothetical protein BHE74_00018358 [Ensete ventricosum]